MPEPVQPVIVRKRATGHDEHHGGAWKVAYADFVTAMMALFIVLWLMNASEEVQKAVGGYFRDPTGSGKETGSSLSGLGEGISLHKQNLNRLKDRIEEAMRQIPEIQKLKDQVKMTVTGEGLRIELLETEDGVFFDTGKPQPSRGGEEMLLLLAKELGKIPNPILIEGHTDSRPYPGERTYTNWELSADRANAARRLMQSAGLAANQVAQVRGYAAQRPRRPDDPTHASNRRVSVIVQYRAETAETEKQSENPSAEQEPKPTNAAETPSSGHGSH